MILQEGDRVTLTIERLNYGGSGIGHYRDMVIFVPRTAPGDEILTEIIEVKKRYAIGILLDLLHPSPLRTAPPCRYYSLCGGCQLQHLDYSAQIGLKREIVRETLERIGKLTEIPVKEMIGASEPFHYRNKGTYHIDVDQGKPLVGFVSLDKKSVIDIEECLIQEPLSHEIFKKGREALTGARERGDHAYRALMIRVGRNSKEGMAVFIAKENPQSRSELLRTFSKETPLSLWLNINRKKNHSNLGDEFEHVGGPLSIRETIGGVKYLISPESFFQINTAQTEKLYDLVLQYANPQGHEIILDLYSGTGGITLYLARFCRVIYGFEMSRKATQDAEENARLNGITNCSFRTGKVETTLLKFFTKQISPHTAVLDPPRAGCSPKVLDLLSRMKIRKIVYASCSPPTLARDLKILKSLGYQILEVQPIDMFPQTYHIETVTLLTNPGL
ncbi:MAG: 23S rRNA (uracil(1939)-C(5))-methyltransferase RlmD [Candidatus Tectomicrobia bacterium]|nr:23S rRNA (uracil(1939)-C(5))-methyltransferase RlmD [Candidatus Tectomicrobia bacterium]